MCNGKTILQGLLLFWPQKIDAIFKKIPINYTYWVCYCIYQHFIRSQSYLGKWNWSLFKVITRTKNFLAFFDFVTTNDLMSSLAFSLAPWKSKKTYIGMVCQLNYYGELKINIISICFKRFKSFFGIISVLGHTYLCMQFHRVYYYRN